jgi:hypothetical protein
LPWESVHPLLPLEPCAFTQSRDASLGLSPK